MSVALVAGALANKPRNGGAAWTRLSWAVGLRELGFDVHFVEQLDGRPDDRALRWARQILDAFALPATVLDGAGSTVAGLDRRSLEDLAAEASLLVNISGHLGIAAIRDRVATRVYVDLDPGYTQLWHADGLLDLDGHDHYRTVGLAIGTDSCALPTGALPWRPIVQPVLLAEWPCHATEDRDLFTTVASWRGPYGTLDLDGRRLGPKAHQFRRFVDLPARAPGRFELALDIDPADAADRAALQEHGWRLRNPQEVADGPAAFRRYVRSSGAECSVAQGMYVETRCGWFADRTTRYLATGRPALVQDTGFRAHLPVGDGLIAFSTPQEAVAGARRITAAYDHHAAAARQLAEQHFDAGLVLGRLCEEVDVAP